MTDRLEAIRKRLDSYGPKDVSDLLAEVSRLSALLKEREQDTARLDWLDARKGGWPGWSVEIVEGAASIAPSSAKYRNSRAGLRAAIDAAMKEQGE